MLIMRVDRPVGMTDCLVHPFDIDDLNFFPVVTLYSA